MLSSPAKRRKINATSSIDVNGINTDLDQQSRPTTPTRASYLSPTKASLARSHPHLAHQNQRPSLTEPRGRSLRDDLLKAQPPSEATNPPPNVNAENAANRHEQQKLQDTGRETLLQQALTAPRTEPRPPLQNRQPSTKLSATHQDFLQPPIVPKLVKRFEGSTPARGVSPPDHVQPALPPTPVELGWEDPPERPRGLSSSSPRGSRSGSGRHRQRMLESQSITSSPLKPKKHQQVVPDIHDQESEAEMAENEPQFKPVPQPPTALDEPPEELDERKVALERLKAELAALEKSTVKLERALSANEAGSDVLDDQDVLKHFSASLHPSRSLNTNLEQLSTDKTEATKYLELFAPANLQLHSHTTTKTVKGQPKVVHHINVVAPPPWPPHAFSAAFDITADAETARVENIIWTDTLPGKTQAVGISDGVFDWLDKCMKSTLHGCNVGNLIWGLSQYFEKAVQRARAFEKLSAQYQASNIIHSSDKEGGGITVIKDGKPLDEDQALALTRHLTRSQMTFDLPTAGQDAGARTRKGRKAEPKVMINWSIDLSWNGAAKSVCEITPSGIPDQSIQHVKELFSKLHPIQGLEGAFGAVYDLVKGQQEGMIDSAVVDSRQGSEIPEARAKAKGKKRMRFT